MAVGVCNSGKLQKTYIDGPGELKCARDLEGVNIQ
jgi:hypothetical protein